MGKSRQNRVRKNRVDPIAKPVKPPSDPELAKLREIKILPVLKDLKSPDAKSRTTAASAIANIVQDAKCRKLLLREQVVHVVLTETLTDNSIDSRAAGWEILKVLAEEEEPDFCVHLYRLDILTAIEHAVKAVLDTLTATEPSFSKLLKAQQRLVWDITDSVLTLLGFLALAKEDIPQAIVANQTIMRLLFRLASTDIAPQEVFEETLSCLMTLSEDNLQFGQAITNDQETQCYDVLLKLATGSGPRAVLSSGVLHNVFSSLQWLDHSPGKDGACDAILIPSLTRALEHVTPGSSSDAGITLVALEILASIGTDFQTTLEKGNRAPSGAAKADEEWNGIEDADAMDVDQGSDAGADEDDEGQDDGEEEEAEDDDDSINSDIEADIERVAGADGTDSGDIDDLPTLCQLLQQAVPHLIRLSNMPVDSEESLAIQTHSLSALNNIAWTIACLDFTSDDNANIFEAWSPVAKKIWRKTIAPILEADSADLNLATQVTSLAWAIARTLHGATPAAGAQHRKFISLYRASAGQPQPPGPAQDDEAQQDPFQGLGVKCIGVLGSLARDPAPLEVNREVGVFLVTLLGSDASQTTVATPMADVVEALNQLFDMYGDEEAPCDREVFWKDGFLKHLEEFVPRMKVLVKGVDKRTQAELRTRADEALLNLGRFVGYKRKHVPK